MPSSQVSENLVLYDWLSFTTKKYDVNGVIKLLGLQAAPWTDLAGARGYKDRKYFNSISIHYNGRDDMGVWCELSGQGCRAFESYSDVGWPALFAAIRDENMHLTRLDVAFDDHTGILPMPQIIQDTQGGFYVSKSDYWETLLSSKGSTVQIGSSKSAILIRIYDKAAEKNIPDEHWVRCEMQLRDERATAFTEVGLNIGEAFAGVLSNYLRYVDPIDDSNRWRWPMKDYWAELLDGASRIRLYSNPGTDYNEDRCKRYVVRQAGNAIDACLRMYGVDDFLRMIEYRPQQPNPKYDAVVKQHFMSSSSSSSPPLS